MKEEDKEYGDYDEATSKTVDYTRTELKISGLYYLMDIMALWKT